MSYFIKKGGKHVLLSGLSVKELTIVSSNLARRLSDLEREAQEIREARIRIYTEKVRRVNAKADEQAAIRQAQRKVYKVTPPVMTGRKFKEA